MISELEPLDSITRYNKEMELNATPNDNTITSINMTSDTDPVLQFMIVEAVNDTALKVYYNHHPLGYN